MRVASEGRLALVAVQPDLVGQELEMQRVVVGAGVNPGDEVDRASERVCEQPRAGREGGGCPEELRHHDPRMAGRANLGARRPIAENGHEFPAVDRCPDLEHRAHRVRTERDQPGIQVGGERAKHAIHTLGIREIGHDIDRDAELFRTTAHDLEASEVSTEQQHPTAGLRDLNERLVISVLEAKRIPLPGQEEQPVQADLCERVEMADDVRERRAMADAAKVIARGTASAPANDRVVQRDDVEKPAGDAAPERTREQHEHADRKHRPGLGDLAPVSHAATVGSMPSPGW